MLQAGVGIDPAITQKRPMRPMFVHAFPFDISQDDFFPIDRTFGNDFAAGCRDEALPPEFDAIAPGGRFVSDPVSHGDVTAVGDGVAALNRFPGGMLRDTKLFLLFRMPPNRGWIE